MTPAATKCFALSLALFIAHFAAAPASGQALRRDPVKLNTSLRSQPFDNLTRQDHIVELGAVSSQGASWLRLRIPNYELGQGSVLRISSTEFEQLLDPRVLSDSNYWTMVFPGPEVNVELHVAAGDTGIYAEIDQVITPADPDEPLPAAIRSICNDFDDRISSNDSRVGRLSVGCTGWLVSNGAVLTAGHCAPIPAGAFMEFNVPGSLPNGLSINSTAANTYPIDVASVVMENNGRGEDWMIFRLNRHPTTGLRAHDVQGYFFMTNLSPEIDTTLRVTGYGVDNTPPGPGTSICTNSTNNGATCSSNAQCFPLGVGVCMAPDCCDPDGTGPDPCQFNCNANAYTQQSTTGRLDDIEGTTIEHDVDSMPGNSGGPIEWENTGGYTIGIHTSGGCDSFLDGYNNHGTHFTRGTLAAAVQNFLGPATVYVDWFDAGLPANGNVFEPLHTISSAVAAAPDNGVIAAVEGFYPRAAGNTFVAGADGKAVTFVAPVGPVVIGE